MDADGKWTIRLTSEQIGLAVFHLLQRAKVNSESEYAAKCRETARIMDMPLAEACRDGVKRQAMMNPNYSLDQLCDLFDRLDSHVWDYGRPE